MPAASQAKRMGRYVVDQAVLGAPPPPQTVQSPNQQLMQQQAHQQAASQQGSMASMQQRPPSPRQEVCPCWSARSMAPADCVGRSQAAHGSMQGKVHVSSPVRSGDLATPDPALQCPESFLCLTQGVVPSTGDLQKKTRLPFGAVCRPVCASWGDWAAASRSNASS